MEEWGELASGETVERVTISGGGLTAKIITRGAAIQDLRLEGHDAPLVLGFERLRDYEFHSPYFGATVGRFANRIAGGHFVLNGVGYHVDKNDHGHCLHGGRKGFSERLWTIEDAGESHVVMRIESADGDMGFPGHLIARCRYEVADRGELRVILTAEADAPTVCSMAHHSYFNLENGGAGPVTGHELMIAADSYLPVDNTLIPVGPPQPVAGTKFDFREMKPITASDPAAAYDHNFCLGGNGRVREVAQLWSPRTSVLMKVLTTEPGLQLFTAPGMAMTVPGLGGRRYGHHAGLCLEAQAWPDAPNRPDYPSATLNPGEVQAQRTIYIFSKA
ncbi:aldose epimerase family protein [Oricola thermophila]|uniref:Aldose 1-epimerase n=1 Tax=Oricola thermophila TaxID=2742145 RepID=A0A6N1V8Y1_9HYPH|nr:aldose epimerase family protein [Oricola thermophila]QKV17424.1 galactose mutarotase [Oricola thermophila]